jgi:tetratricopeptide (TPR) repeat protein
MGKKDPRKNIQKQLTKAKQLFQAKQYKKAGKFFNSAAENLLKLREHDLAKKSFSKAADSYIEEEIYSQCLEALRNAGDSCLLDNKFLEGLSYFKEAINYIPNLRNSGERNFYFVLFSSLAYLCQFLKGRQEKGLILLKKIKKEVDDTYFKEHALIRLITNLTVAIRDFSLNNLNKIEDEFKKLQFREAEQDLVRKALVLARAHLSINTELKLDRKQYKTNDTITLTLDIDTKSLMEISKYPFYNYSIKELKILNISLPLSDNLIAQEKPNFPIIVNPGQEIKSEFVIKPSFQLDNPYIGPVSLICEIDDNFNFTLETRTKLEPDLISPPPALEISIKNLRPPLIGKSFPMEIQIENNSQGEAININIEATFPDELKLMRGTTTKQVYSLKPNENISWELSLKPIEAGDYITHINLNFKDPDQNLIELSKTFPLSIKL